MRTVNKIIKIPLYIILIVILYSCEKEKEYDSRFPNENIVGTGSYSGEYWPTREWRNCKPENVGVSSEELKKLNKDITLLLKIHFDIQSVLVIRKGYIVAEQYYSEKYSKDSLHPVYSCTKSVISALCGIAINDGYIDNVDKKVLDFFPEYTIENLDQRKNGIPFGGHALYLKPRDMAKFGYLYLKNGVWDGKQIVPQNWVEDSFKKHIRRKYLTDFYYGYQWWISNYNTYSAVGYGKQWIIVIPYLDMVVVFCNNLKQGDYEQMTTPERLLKTYIIPAVSIYTK